MSGECTSARRWLSAFRDDEALDDPVARMHVDACPDCAAWADAADVLTRRVRLRLAGAPAVTSAAVQVRRAAVPPVQQRQVRLARAVLAVAGTAGLVLSVFGLLDLPGYVATAGTHLGWELYSFEAALAVGFLLSARRPQRHLSGLLPVTGLVTVLTLVPAALGLAAPVNVLMELSHATFLLGFVGLLLLADVRRRDGTRALEPTTVPAGSRLA